MPSKKHRFGRYEMQEEIGEGAMGRVYRAFDPLVRRTVAIKTVKSEYLTRETAEEFLKRFQRESQAAGALAHPNIVSVFDVGRDYFVMEYLEGVTLHGLLRMRGCLSVAETFRIIAPVADALDYAHRAGVIHRDIKPANIMVLRDGRPKLMDFGVAHCESSLITAPGVFLGSPSYMAPEQITNSEVSDRSDVFSLAVVTYETITGQKPFSGNSITGIIYSVVNQPHEPPRRWNSALPARYDEVFQRALSKDPRQRFASATAFVSALEPSAFDSTLPAVATPGVMASASALHSEETRAIERSWTLRAITAFHRWSWRASRLAFGARVWVWGVALLALASVSWLPGGPRTFSVSSSPPPRLALLVEAEPRGASVWIDGRHAGQTPVRLTRLLPGSHRVRVSQPGFAPAGLTFELTPGAAPPPLRFVLEPTSARLYVSSEPADAGVRVDGQPVGHTPLAALLLSAGTHEIRVGHAGYAPQIRRVNAQVGQDLAVDARLERSEATRLVRSTSLTPSSPPLVHEASVDPSDPSVIPPRRIAGAIASYPKEAARLRLLGSVGGQVTVSETGEPTEIRVTESAGEILDQAAVEAIRSWRFEPARLNGAPVRYRLSWRQTFKRGA